MTAEGAKNKGIAFEVAHLKCPACVNPGSPMPSFAGLGDALSQIQRAVAAVLVGVAIKGVITQLEGAVAGHRMVEADRAAFQACQRDDELEGRARRIGPADRLVDQRRGLVVQQRFP